MQNEVTQADRRLAFHLFSHVALPESAAKALRGEIDDNPIVKYASEARIAAAKEAEQAVLDRLLPIIEKARDLCGIVIDAIDTGDEMLVVEKATELLPIADTALADALEGKPVAGTGSDAMRPLFRAVKYADEYNRLNKNKGAALLAKDFITDGEFRDAVAALAQEKPDAERPMSTRLHPDNPYGDGGWE